MRRLLDYDDLTKVKTYHHYDHASRKTHFEYVQDVEPVIENNKALQNDSSYSQAGMKKNRLHFASIPAVVQLKWYAEHGVKIWDKNDMPKIFRLLNDPEYRHLKVTDKKIIL